MYENVAFYVRGVRIILWWTYVLLKRNNLLLHFLPLFSCVLIIVFTAPKMNLQKKVEKTWNCWRNSASKKLVKTCSKEYEETPTPPPKAQRKHKENNKEQRYIKPTLSNIKTWGLFGAYLGFIWGLSIKIIPKSYKPLQKHNPLKTA